MCIRNIFFEIKLIYICINFYSNGVELLIVISEEGLFICILEKYIFMLVYYVYLLLYYYLL